MKSFLRIVVPALALGVMSGSMIRADDQTAPPPGVPGEGHRGMMDPAKQVQGLDAVLNFTDDQRAKITDIYKKAQTDMQALRSGGGSPDETMAKRQEIQKSTHDQIRALLTADQQTKFDAMPPPGPGHDGFRGGEPGGPGGDATPPPIPAPTPSP